MLVIIKIAGSSNLFMPENLINTIFITDFSIAKLGSNIDYILPELLQNIPQLLMTPDNMWKMTIFAS